MKKLRSIILGLTLSVCMVSSVFASTVEPPSTRLKEILGDVIKENEINIEGDWVFKTTIKDEDTKEETQVMLLIKQDIDYVKDGISRVITTSYDNLSLAGTDGYTIEYYIDETGDVGKKYERYQGRDWHVSEYEKFPLENYLTLLDDQNFKFNIDSRFEWVNDGIEYYIDKDELADILKSQNREGILEKIPIDISDMVLNMKIGPSKTNGLPQFNISLNSKSGKNIVIPLNTDEANMEVKIDDFRVVYLINKYQLDEEISLPKEALDAIEGEDDIVNVFSDALGKE